MNEKHSQREESRRSEKKIPENEKHSDSQILKNAQILARRFDSDSNLRAFSLVAKQQGGGHFEFRR